MVVEGEQVVVGERRRRSTAGEVGVRGAVPRHHRRGMTAKVSQSGELSPEPLPFGG